LDTKELKKLIKEAVLKEAAQHKIAGDLSVYADQPHGSNLLQVSFENRKTADHISVSMDKKDVLDAVKALLTAANIDARELTTAMREQLATTPGPAPVGEQTITEDMAKGKKYAVFAAEYEPHMFDEVKTAQDIMNSIKEHSSYNEFIGVFKCIGVPSYKGGQMTGVTEQLATTPGPAPVGETVEANPLDGLKKEKVKKALYKIMKLDSLNGKYFTDTSWAPIHTALKVLDSVNIPYTIEKDEYKKDDKGTPISKEWLVRFDFKNEKGKDTFLYLLIVAAGAGSVQDPLSRYDLVVYFTN
jgi:hypothetical protein